MHCSTRRTTPTRTASDWTAAVTALRASSAPHASLHFGALYRLVHDEAPRLLRCARDLDDDRRRDLAIELLIEKLPAVLGADCPRAYFATALVHRARSWLRSPRAAVVDEARAAARATEHAEERAVFVLAARAAIGAMSDRELTALLADAEGQSRDEIAATLGTSRANVDQIISRARRKVAARDAA